MRKILSCAVCLIFLLGVTGALLTDADAVETPAVTWLLPQKLKIGEAVWKKPGAAHLATVKELTPGSTVGWKMNPQPLPENYNLHMGDDPFSTADSNGAAQLFWCVNLFHRTGNVYSTIGRSKPGEQSDSRLHRKENRKSL